MISILIRAYQFLGKINNRGASRVDISPVNDYFTLEIIEGGLSPWPRGEQRNPKK